MAMTAIITLKVLALGAMAPGKVWQPVSPASTSMHCLVPAPPNSSLSASLAPQGSKVCRRSLRPGMAVSPMAKEEGGSSSTGYEALELEPAGRSETLTGTVLHEDEGFNPLEEIEEADLMRRLDERAGPLNSLARQRYSPDAETAINDVVNIAYSMSYAFHAMYAFFDRDNVALPGIAKYFRDKSDDERDKARAIMEYQNQRGGHVELKPLPTPWTEFDDEKKGDALTAFEVALSLEKVQNEKYLNLSNIARDLGDPQLDDWVKNELLHPQIEKVKREAEYVAQLRRVGKGLGAFQFDRFLDGDEA